jgi:quercetin dioxygenase-like cupin family protein
MCLLCLATSAVLAQDVMKVTGGPDTHKVVLDNDTLRMLDVRIKPGQKIAMHSHPPNTVYYMTDCKLQVTSPDGKTTVAEPKAGTAIYRGGETKHSVENLGGECHLVQTELKEKK